MSDMIACLRCTSVSMGFAAAFWFRDSLLEIAKLSNTRNVFRSFREGNKVFVVQKSRMVGVVL